MAYLDVIFFLDTLEEEPDKSLEGEIRRYLREECSSDDEPATSETARHFAEWGAEHLRDSTKMIDKSLEEAAEEYAVEYAKRNTPKDADGEIWRVGDVMIENRMSFEDGFIAGAKWQKEQMLKAAVEGYVGVHLTEEGSKVTVNSGYLPKEMGIKNGYKVKLIIVKEDK